MPDDIETQTASAISDTATSANALATDLSGITLASLHARLTAVESQVSSASTGNVAAIATLAQSAADTAEEAKSVAADASAGVAAVKEDVGVVTEFWADFQPMLAKLKSFFSHL